MRRTVVLASLAAVLLVAGLGRSEDRGPVTHHALWKVEGGRRPVYLLGSIHILRPQHYPLERPIEDAFDDARVVAFEVDLDEARAVLEHRKQTSAVHAKTSRPKTLRSQVSKKTYDAVVEYLEAAHLPGTLLDPFPPSLAAAVLMEIQLRQLGYDPQWGVDAYFYRRARKYGKTVVPLETVDEQLGALDDLSEHGSDELVSVALKDAAALQGNLRDLIRAWKGGEIDRLEAIVNSSFRDHPEIYQHLLVDRNARWIPKIEALLAGDVPALVIVGTGHLVGADSVVAMLGAKGYTVRQQ
jgi:uncharacterized protein YbaP (TraB family)